MTDKSAGGNRAALGGHTSIVVRRLGAFAPLSSDELKVLTGLKGRSIEAGTLLEPSTEAGGGWIIQSGWCGKLAPGRDRGRPLLTLLLPGDSFGVGAAPWAGDSMAIRTLTPCVLLDASPLRQIVRLRPPGNTRLIEACQRAGSMEQLYALNQLARLSGLAARPRVAHFLVELFVRLDCVGLAPGGFIDVPIRQMVVADLLGQSEIHFNRILRQLKSDGLIDVSRSGVTILDKAGLADAAKFNLDAFHMALDDPPSAK